MLIYSAIVVILVGACLVGLAILAKDIILYDIFLDSKANRKKWGIANKPEAKVVKIKYFKTK